MDFAVKVSLELFSLVTHFGIDSNVMGWILPAVPTQTCLAWFTKTLKETTNEYIEVVMCGGQPERDDVPFQLKD